MANYWELVSLVQNSLIAGAVLGVMGGLIGVFVMARDMAFAVHGIAELTFAGAAAGLLLGVGVVTGALGGAIIAGLIIGLLGEKARNRNSIVAVLMPFGLGLGILFLALAPGRSANKFGLLTGQIVAVADQQVWLVVGLAAAVIVSLLAVWRPLLYASVDAHVAASRGVPLRALSVGFMLLLAVAVALSVQIIGALLVLALLVTPAATALKLSSSPVMVPLLAMAFAVISMVGGILLALPWAIPVSPFITSLSFALYLAAWAIAALRTRKVGR
ncbi:MAG: metal ABC transporter permease [Agromyces sp.]